MALNPGSRESSNQRMIEQQGRVVSVSVDRAQVRLGGTSGCPSCDQGKGCGAGVFGKLLKRNPVVLELENGIDAERGQAVMVGISEGTYLRLVARLYLVPLLAGMSGAAVAYYLSTRVNVSQASSDAITLLCGIACGAVALIRNRKHSMEFHETFIVHLLRIV